MAAEWDLVIAGAGPAGSTVAHLCAAAGLKVLVFEAEQFPRFHIGESLLPVDLPIFARLGFEPAVSGHVRKRGACFIDEARARSSRFHFEDGLAGTPGHAYQVERAQFDMQLATLASAAGAEIRFGTKVAEVDFFDDRVRVVAAGQTTSCRYFVDATGQRAFLGRRHRSVSPIDSMGSSAVFQRYTGLEPSVVDELFEHGDIQIFLREQGWSWVIPVRESGEPTLSIGMVSARDSLRPESLLSFVEQSPLVKAWTSGAVVQAPGRVANFSYRNRQKYGARWACVGDAACFLDPIFSSGVTLALVGGEALADRLVAALAEADEARPDLMAAHAEHMERGYQCFERFIERFYHTGMVENLFFSTPPRSDMWRGVVSVLAGDVWRDDNPFQNILLGAQRRPKRVLPDLDG